MIAWRIMEGKQKSFTLFKICAENTTHSFPFPRKLQGDVEDLVHSSLQKSLPMSSVLIEVLRSKGAQIFTQSASLRGAPWRLRGGHQQAFRTESISPVLRDHSFPSGASHPHFPLPFQRRLGRCFMNCVHEYFCAYSKNVFS